VPDALIAAMRAAPCLDLQLPDDERVALLLEDYGFFVSDTAMFSERLDALLELRGKAVVNGWKQKIAQGHIEEVVRDLLLTHYDPGYAQSMVRNFSRYADAVPLVAADRSGASLAALARSVIQR
jgi:tRNA 2-selenouridine synthase